MSKRIILIAGPTASGKSALAIDLAMQYDGVVINADSMQVYGQLELLTARPDKQETEKVIHLLYGHRSATQNYSVAKWLADIEPILQRCDENESAAIIVGGTGLYFQALIEGLSPVPPIDMAIRAKWRSASPDKVNLHEELARLDPEVAEKLRSSDNQRILRALEVFESTGKSISHWQKKSKGVALVDAECAEKIILMPPRHILHDRINIRFDMMMDAGAIEEVEALLKLDVDPQLPAMKAIGVAQIAKYLNSEWTLETAIEKSKAASRQYAKRQSTWFNNQFKAGWKRVEFSK